MTKSIQVSDAVHDKLFRLKGYLLEGNMSNLLDRVFLHAGYGPAFFKKWTEIIKQRPELAEEKGLI